LPTYLRIAIADPPSRIREGTVLGCDIHLGPLRFEWKIEVTDYSPPYRFIDIQREGPFRYFAHEHTFEAKGDSTRLTDVIEYELPPGSFSELASRIVLEERILDVLRYGHEATKTLIEKKKT
jgi:ligand-binding SRPBCC domain-containing protein